MWIGDYQWDVNAGAISVGDKAPGLVASFRISFAGCSGIRGKRESLKMVQIHLSMPKRTDHEGLRLVR